MKAGGEGKEVVSETLVGDVGSICVDMLSGCGVG